VAVSSRFSLEAATCRVVSALLQTFLQASILKMVIEMKKLYSRPTLVKRQQLAVVTAAAFSNGIG
jgi:hypothetical protein